MSEKKKTLSLCASPTTIAAVDALAARQRRSRSSVLLAIVEHAVAHMTCVHPKCGLSTAPELCPRCGEPVDLCRAGHAFDQIVEPHECEEDLDDEDEDDEDEAQGDEV